MKKILSLVSIILSVSLIFGAVIGLNVSAEEKIQNSDAALTVSGNQIFNGSGEAVRLIGLSIPYMSWSDNSENKVLEALDIALDEWGSNAVRLAVTPELWFGKNMNTYRGTADKVIEKATAAGKYVILDNHSFYLPDDNDIKFWNDAAQRYKNHPNVLFELFNEPAACTWQQYYEGGKLTFDGTNDWGEKESVVINACGIPKLFETVRSTGAKNICILPGINWSFDLSCCTEEDFKAFAKSVAESEAPDDVENYSKQYTDKYFMKETTGNGIMYTTHPYPTKPTDWDQYLKNTLLEYPVLIGECGPTEKTSGFLRTLSDNDKSYLDTLIDYTDKYEIHITPWAWGAWPFLNQEPSNKLSAYGTYMKKYFEKSLETKAITLYNGVDYTGESYTLEAGSYTASTLEKYGFALSDLKSASSKEDNYQYTVTLFENEDYTGNSYTFVPNAANVGKEICGFTAKAMRIERSIPENILLGHAKVIAKGSVENQVPENIIDGKTITFWKYVDENPNEVVISLDGLYALNGITLAHASAASMMSVFNASDYTVSVSTDGKTFTRIIDVTGNSMGLCKYDFEQVLASYIKIRFTKGSIVDNSTYYLTEIMAYGTQYTGSTDGLDFSIGAYNTSGSDVQEESFPLVEIILICVFGAVILCSAAVLSVMFLRRKRR